LKSRQDTSKILLDTSFILPSLGIDVGEEVTKCLKGLADAGSKADIYYSQFSILESLWVAARLSASPTFDPESISLGLRSIIEGHRYTKVIEDSRTFSNALKIYTLGHRDMIDNILYANSVLLNLKLLTLDNKLRDFINERGLENTLVSSGEITRDSAARAL
jgi:hypothetical protein